MVGAFLWVLIFYAEGVFYDYHKKDIAPRSFGPDPAALSPSTEFVEGEGAARGTPK